MKYSDDSQEGTQAVELAYKHEKSTSGDCTHTHILYSACIVADVYKALAKYSYFKHLISSAACYPMIALLRVLFPQIMLVIIKN